MPSTGTTRDLPVPPAEKPPSWPCRCLSCVANNAVVRFFRRNFLPFCLIFFITMGVLFPGPGAEMAKTPVTFFMIGIIFFIQGLSLNFAAAKRALRHIKSILFGVVFIFGVTPLAAFPLLALHSNPPELALGLAVFACMPTTISSGVALVSESGGNVASALLMTIITNLSGIVVSPLLIDHYVLSRAGMRLDYLSTIRNMSMCILAPLVVGQSLRLLLPCVPKLVLRFREPIGYISSIALSVVPYSFVSASHALLSEVPPHSIPFLLGVATSVHCAYLVFTALVSYVAGIELEFQKVLVVLGSQKSLGLALPLITFMPDGIGSKGLVSITCIISHLIQTLIDSVIVSRWKHSTTTKPTLNCLFRDIVDETAEETGGELLVRIDYGGVDAESQARRVDLSGTTAGSLTEELVDGRHLRADGVPVGGGRSTRGKR